MGITTWIILAKLSFLMVNGHYRDANYEHWMRQAPRRPVDVMTDVINNLGVNILQQYHVPGNVAFSPTGLGFVLIALYEGSAGRGSKQIGEALHLPHDRQITRIGLRDIHRRLRSYLNADGFLGGLNLNKDNTRLRPEFEDILRFYGFDFTIDNTQMNATDSTTTGNSTASTILDSGAISTMQDTMNGITTMIPDGSTGNDASTIALSAATIESASVTTISPIATTVPTTNPPTTTIDTSVDIITVTPNNAAAIMQSTTSADAGVNSSTTARTSTIEILEMPLNTTDMPARLSSIAAEPNLSTQMIVNNPGSASDPRMNRVPGGVTDTTSGTASFRFSPPMAAATISATQSAITTQSATTIESTTATESATTTESVTVTESVTTTEAATFTEPMTSTTVEATSPISRTVPARSTAFSSSTTTANSRPSTLTLRSTTSDNFRIASRILEAMTSTMKGTKMTIPFATTTTADAPTSTTTDIPTSTTTDPPSTMIDDALMRAQTLSLVENPSSNNVRKRRSAEHYFSSYPDDGLWMQHLNIWRPPQEADEASVRDSKQVAFLVNGCDVATVSAATYTAVLPFAYFPSLKAVAVEFPLDNPRYNVILFLPTERPDTLRLARDLGSKSLLLLRKHLQPTWIRATIPSFMLKGFVTLTPYLQRLGIRDVFEPRAANLSPMTPDIGVYARDVQQSIGVNIRNYMEPDRTSSSESSQQEFPLIVPPRRDSYRFLYPGNGLLERAGPVSFVAEHPFLYFIIDTETSVTLITGRIDDPLNSRIL